MFPLMKLHSVCLLTLQNCKCEITMYYTASTEIVAQQNVDLSRRG